MHSHTHTNTHTHTHTHAHTHARTHTYRIQVRKWLLVLDDAETGHTKFWRPSFLVLVDDMQRPYVSLGVTVTLAAAMVSWWYLRACVRLCDLWLAYTSTRTTFSHTLYECVCVCMCVCVFVYVFTCSYNLLGTLETLKKGGLLVVGGIVVGCV